MAKQKERESKKALDLSRAERAFLSGLQAREREIQRDYVAPLQEDYQAFVDQIQFNHGVTLGKDYLLNPNTGQLIPNPEAEKEEAPEAEEKPKAKLKLVKPAVAEE